MTNSIRALFAQLLALRLAGFFSLGLILVDISASTAAGAPGQTGRGTGDL